ncbi:MAG: heparinase II/III family protein [Actinoplanes sp.]
MLPVTPPASWDAATVRELLVEAKGELGTPWPVLLGHEYARYHRDGDRDAYERIVRVREARTSRAAVAAAVTGDPRWIDEAGDGVLLLCEQSSWCWPAHDDTFTRHGSVLPTVTDPYLDLGAGEVAGQLAWIDRLLGAAFDERLPGLRERIRYETDRRVLTPFLVRTDWHWLGLDGHVNNWNPWVHGNLLAATLQLVDDPGRRTELITRITEGLDRYAASLPPDGAIDEGYSYWWNGACRLLEADELLDRPTVRAAVAFPHRVHLGGAWYLNHADGPARPDDAVPWDALHRAARRVGDVEAEAHAAAHRRPGEPVADLRLGLGRLLRALGDPDWAAAVPGPSPLPRRVWFPSTQVFLARPTAGRTDGLTLAVKGGHNDESHNHNDLGSVLVAVDGVPTLIDPGRPTYTAQTFGPDRYDIWTMRSAWHNTPTVGGVEQSPGRAQAAVVLDRDDNGLTLDLTAAYPGAGLQSWTRTARLHDDGTVTVTDSWQLDPQPAAPTVIHWIAAGDVVCRPGQAEIGTLRLTWTPPVPASLTVRELDDPMLTAVWGDRLTRLDLDVSGLGPAGTLDLIVKEHR